MNFELSSTTDSSKNPLANSLRYAMLCLGLAASLGLAANLTGCAPLIVVGGAATGYYVEKDDRKLGEIVDDVEITASIKARYFKDPQVSAIDINVDTRGGIVTLYGNVTSDQQEERAIYLASKAKGVKKIISKLTIVLPK